MPLGWTRRAKISTAEFHVSVLHLYQLFIKLSCLSMELKHCHSNTQLLKGVDSLLTVPHQHPPASLHWRGRKKSQMTNNGIHRNSMAPMTMPRNLFLCTQTWGQIHHRFGTSQALGQFPGSASGRTRDNKQATELIMAERRVYCTFSTYKIISWEA